MRLLLTACLAAGLANASIMYTVTDLGPFAETTPVAALAGNYGVLPGGTWSAAYGVNSSGEVVGYGNTTGGAFRAFTWTASGGLNMLATLGGSNSWGMAINDSGTVAGHSTTARGYVHAFLGAGGQFIDLGTLGGTSSYAYGIDNARNVVGYSSLADGNLHAYLYSGGTMQDLNLLIPHNSGWMLTQAYTIDNAGSITGTGVYNGSLRQFRLDPAQVPETTSMALVGLGLTLLGTLTRRFRR